MDFDRQPCLQGPALSLRPLRVDDVDALYAAASDPLTWEQHPARDRHEREAFRRFFDDALASGGTLVLLDPDGVVIGCSRYDGWTAGPPSSVEIGWTFVRRDHWGDGTNREMKRLMLDHAFASVDRVRFRVAAGNIRSQRAVTSLGACRLPGAGETLHGVEHVAFELCREDWPSS